MPILRPNAGHQQLSPSRPTVSYIRFLATKQPRRRKVMKRMLTVRFTEPIGRSSTSVTSLRGRPFDSSSRRISAQDQCKYSGAIFYPTSYDGIHYINSSAEGDELFLEPVLFALIFPLNTKFVIYRPVLVSICTYHLPGVDVPILD